MVGSDIGVYYQREEGQRKPLVEFSHSIGAAPSDAALVWPSSIHVGLHASANPVFSALTTGRLSFGALHHLHGLAQAGQVVGMNQDRGRERRHEVGQGTKIATVHKLSL